MRGGAAAYSQAIQWVITGKKAHADKAIAILDAYARTLRAVGGHDARLLVGMVDINFANAAEILRHTEADWPSENQERFEHLLRQVFYPVIKDFYPTANRYTPPRTSTRTGDSSARFAAATAACSNEPNGSSWVPAAKGSPSEATCRVTSSDRAAVDRNIRRRAVQYSETDAHRMV